MTKSGYIVPKEENLVPVEAPVAEVTVDSIFAKYAQPDTFEIKLSGGERLTVRSPRDVSDMAAIEQSAEGLFKACERGTVPPEWKQYLPITQEACRMVKFLQLVQKPKFSDFQGIRMSKELGPVLLAIFNAIMEKVGAAVPAKEKEETDDFLSDSGETSSGETI